MLNCYNKVMMNMFCKHDKFVHRYSTHFHSITKIVCDYTGISKIEAEKFLKEHQLEKRKIDFMIDSFETYKRLGFTTKEILENGKLFKHTPREYENHRMVMEEGGFSNFTPALLKRGRSTIKKQITTLKREGLIPMNLNVAESFVSFIKNPEFGKKVEINYDENMKWSAVHLAIAKQFLAWRLQTNEEEINALYSSHKTILNRSFRVMEENISFAEELGFSLRKIRKCGYIIKNYPDHPKQTLKEFPVLVGCDMRQAMRSYPTLIVTPPIIIRKTYEILKEFNIPDESIRTEMGIFQVRPETLRARFNELKNFPDYESLMKIPRLLTVLLHQTKAKRRMNYLKQLNLRCTNFQILGTGDAKEVQQFIRDGKDYNNKFDLGHYLESLLQMEDKSLRHKISKHPYYKNVPLKNIGNTLKYLLDCGFQVSSIYEVLWIVLYPMEKVQTTLNTLKTDHSSSFSSINEVQKLNLILYLIEKDYHFTGNGVFNGEISNSQEQSVK